MQFSQILIAAASDGSGSGVFGTLFRLFLVTAVVWLLIWRLLKPSVSNGLFDDSGQFAESEPAPTPESTPPPPSPSTAIPSQAFTVWTKPSVTSTEADDSKDENQSKDDALADNAIPTLDTATAEEAAAQFQSDLYSGSARQDDKLGIVYTTAPDDADNLKEIKGVAKVLEGKLHEFGVYKFKQIAFWTDTAVAEFGQRLTFKDRIYRDDWIAQAKEFHEKKYGEKL